MKKTYYPLYNGNYIIMKKTHIILHDKNKIRLTDSQNFRIV